ncbi:limonene-1,2-epoxide hydrolase family protein [Jatrophihabitans sp. DSM 45814]
MADPQQVVRNFCGAISTLDRDTVRACMHDEIVFRDPETNMGGGGIEATMRAWEPVFRLFTRFDVEITSIASNGPIVFTERIDHVTVAGEDFEVPCLAVYEVADDRIIRFHDWFDPSIVGAAMARASNATR